MDEPETISQGITNDDGRLDEPLLTDEEMEEGTYQLLFDVSSYYERAEYTDTSFLDTVPVRFRISDPEGHYHVPLFFLPVGTQPTAGASDEYFLDFRRRFLLTDCIFY